LTRWQPVDGGFYHWQKQNHMKRGGGFPELFLLLLAQPELIKEAAVFLNCSYAALAARVDQGSRCFPERRGEADIR
jgi:hypothetical protein